MKKILLIFISALFFSTYVYADNSYSKWAEDSIISAEEAGIVPEGLQSDYTKNITRQEFCRLAVQTYLTKTDNKTNISYETPFEDIDDDYITTAYYLRIVSGVNDKEFAPYNNITRQEAAVMLNNLADVLNVYNDSPRQEKYVDESYFAQWAKDQIYSVTGIKSEDTYVMTGTEPNKFSPWMNYTREQAIATMWRLYNCDTMNIKPVDAETHSDGYIYYSGYAFNNLSECIYYIKRINKTSGEFEELAKGDTDEILNIEKITDNYIYYSVDFRRLKRISKDGSDEKIVFDGNMGMSKYYITNDNIYCSRSDMEGNGSLIRADMEGNIIAEIPIPEEFGGIYSINAVNGNTVYIDLSNKRESVTEPLELYSYKYSFDTNSFDKAGENEYRAFGKGALTDGKYTYYTFTKIYGESHPMAYHYIYRSNIDGTHSRELSPYKESREAPVPCGSSMLVLHSHNGANIAKIFSNGGVQQLTDIEELKYYYISILEVDDNIIYYRARALGSDDNYLCSVNTDGTNNREICKIPENMNMELL